MTAAERKLTRKPKNITLAFFTAAAFCYLLALLLSMPAPAATVDDLMSGRYAEDRPAIVMPSDSVTICSGSGNYQRCVNRTIPRADPSECPDGDTLITLRKYGVVSRICVPE